MWQIRANVKPSDAASVALAGRLDSPLVICDCDAHHRQRHPLLLQADHLTNRTPWLARVLFACCKYRSLPVIHSHSRTGSPSSDPPDSADSRDSAPSDAGFGKLMFCH